jgi:hypothetical protein
MSAECLAGIDQSSSGFVKDNSRRRWHALHLLYRRFITERAWIATTSYRQLHGCILHLFSSLGRGAGAFRAGFMLTSGWAEFFGSPNDFVKATRSLTRSSAELAHRFCFCYWSSSADAEHNWFAINVRRAFALLSMPTWPLSLLKGCESVVLTTGEIFRNFRGPNQIGPLVNKLRSEAPLHG